MVWGDGLPSGRERAIETLIDREPQGAFYRAARVLDELVPQALANRPNIVTKGALVEQANALVEHEINASNYDDSYKTNNNAKINTTSSHGASGSVPLSVDNTTKERILRHHAKQCSVLQRKNSNKTATSTTPSPQLVAALRNVYGTSADEATSSFNFPSLLKAVMDHKVFESTTTNTSHANNSSTAVGAAETTTTTNTTSNAEGGSSDGKPNDDDTEKAAEAPGSSPKGNKEGGKAPVALIESLIANVCRLVDQNDESHISIIQGLLVAILSVLNQTPSSPNADGETEDGKKNKGNNTSTSKEEQISKLNKNTVLEDPTASPALQVGSLLSLLKLDDNNAGSNADAFRLDQELIDYFGQAAVAYENRIEIQKGRLLARLQQDVIETTHSETDLRTAEPVLDVPTSGDESAATPVALTPTNGGQESTDGNSNDGTASNNNTGIDAIELANRITAHYTDQVAILEADAASQLERLAEATLTSAATLEQIISSAATGDETSSGGDEEEADISSGSGSGSDSDSDEEVDVDNIANATNNGGEEQGGGSPATDDEAQGGEDESSSSSSADDWGAMEGRAGAAGEQRAEGDVEDDNDEDDDDVLQQALALSLSEHNNNRNRSETEAQEEENAGQEEAKAESSAGNAGDEGQATKKDETTQGNEAETATGKASNAEVGSDDTSLPHLPPKPSVHPYASLLGHPLEVDAEESVPLEILLEPYLDPAVFTKFGSIPMANVLVHLLRYTTGIIEKNKLVRSRNDDFAASPTGNPSSVPGGMGLSLFPPSQQSAESGARKDEASNISAIPVTMQLLVALLLHTVEKRNDAIAGLRKSLAQEECHAQGDDMGNEGASRSENVAGDKSPLSSEEEDDPAIALAMNYAEDGVAESSESLEAKGMIRKAAAAAHDAAALLSLLRRRTESWKQNVKLYSFCVVSAMKSLRLFLQSIVRQRVQDLESSTRSSLSVLDCSQFLPSLVGSKLSVSLASLMSVSTHSASVALLNDDDEAVHEVFMPLDLYKEAVATWGECVPLIYPSVNAQVEVLKNLISECSGVESPPNIKSVASLSVMPASDLEPQVHRLQFLCKRLRTADLLDCMVPRPVCFVPDGPEGSDVEGEAKSEDEEGHSLKRMDPFHASSLVSLISSSSRNVCGGKGELQRLLLALCHRFHSRILLWGGLYESSETDVDEVAGAAVAPSSASPGDLVRIGANPSTTLQFDATKCSDSIAILANHGESASSTNGSSVHQRASKVWGTVLSTHHYSPKTGVHRWAIRLDKCERGHVFVGVATAQASMRTYVGGDKYGWGMIGTQALWHDRRKIRGDYGATFRTGSTIVVTLDTDAGTLSFSSWKDSSSSSSFSLDPLLQNQSATRRQGQIGGTVDDWGIAFEGLPLDSRLYPAVGLYQRDDRVTLLTVESSSRSTGRDGVVEITGGLCYYPSPDPAIGLELSPGMEEVRRFNETLSWDGTQYVLEALHYILNCLERNKDEFVVATLLPSLAAALCLVPNSIPTLSEKFALTLLPHISRFLLKLDGFLGERQQVQRLFRTGMRPGKWVIRATGSSGENSDYEEYVVDFTIALNDQGAAIGFEGSGVGTTGKSKNGLVAIFGTTKGSSLHFVEEWSDGNDEGFGSSSTLDETSSCVVAARISLDGTKFEGTYRNVQFGTTGQIAGILQPDNAALAKLRPKDAPSSSKQSAELADGVVTGEGVLCLAFNHMATIIGEDAAGDQINDADTSKEDQMASLRNLLSRKLLCGSSLDPSDPSDNLCKKPMEVLQQFYSWHNDFEDAYQCRHLELLEYSRLQTFFKDHAVATESPLSPKDVENLVQRLDDKLAQISGGKGSLRGRCPVEYDETRRKIICCFIEQCGLHEDLTSESSQLKSVWQAALKITEDGMREALVTSRETGKTQKELCLEKCLLFNHISSFLGSLDHWDKISLADATQEMSTFFRSVRSEFALDVLRKEIEAGTRRSLLRLISIQEAVALLTEIENSGRDVENFIGLEAIVLGLPRLLGRNQTDSLIRIRKPSLARHENNSGNSSFVGTAGSTRLMRLALRNHVHSLFHLLGRLAKKALAKRSQSSSDEAKMPADSLLLALLTFFTITLKDEKIGEMVRGSGILEIITELTSQNKDSISTGPIALADEKSSMVKKLQVICQREISRSILRACVAASHALVFQVSHIAAGEVEEEAESTTLCLELLYSELKGICDAAEKHVAEAHSVATKRRADGDWEKWCETLSSSNKKTEKRTSAEPVGSAGLQYLHEHGTTHSCGLLPASQRPSSRQKQSTTPSSRTSSDTLSRLQSGFVFELLSQWLHIICGVLYSSLSSSHLANDSKWVSLLMWAVGLSADIKDGSVGSVSRRDEQVGLLPARFRSRILRFLLPLLDAMEPDEKVVIGLLCLAGQALPSITRSADEDEKFVAREAVTLLRQLHSPIRPVWRRCVNRVLSMRGQGGMDGPDELVRRLGVLSFLSGSLEAIGRGSYVLLKPAAAVPLSVDQQSSPSSKGHASGVGGTGSGIGATPHHIVGNGTEGVVAGLCRHDASAGLVSNIDLKNGICEVVLLTRDPYGPDETGDTLLLSKPPVGSTSPKHTLTVRALRTALSDVVHAQEAPLHLDETMSFDNMFASMMEPALTALFAIMKPDAGLKKLGTELETDASDIDELKSGVTNVSMAMMLLRSVIVILSDKRIAVNFLQRGSTKDTLSRILRLAWPAEMEKENLSDFVSKAQRSFLSSLPAHEARYGHLVSMLSDLALRDKALAAVSDEEWAKRLEEFKVRQATSEEEQKTDSPASTGGADESAAPSASDTGQERTQASGSGGSLAATSTGDADAGARASEASNRAVSQSTMGSNSEEEEESEAAATAAAHLREAAIAQMAELGLPRSWSELALRRTGGNDIEAAVHFCLERGGEMERLLAEERERERLMQRQSGGAQSSRRRGYRGETGSSNHLLRQLLEMGFPSRWCAEALAATGNNVDEALTWILTHGERLSEEDEAMEEEDDGEDVDDEDDSNDDDDEDDDDAGGSVSVADGTGDASAAPKAVQEETKTDAGNNEPESVWSGSVVPLRFISGRSIIDSKTLAISGLPTGGFSSVGTKGILLCSGKWYYEAILETAGCLQIGWADGSFAGHCHADRGDGTGDGPSSWAFDGWRRYRWHSTATEWGCRWKEGDVVGCMVDMDAKTVSFTLNGRGEEIGMGQAFSGEGFRPCGGVYACVSFNRREKLRLRLSEPFKHQPPPGYKGVGEAVMEAVKEREVLAEKEQVLEHCKSMSRTEPKRFLCDFSDGEHGHELMAWAHRYYGSDASVHLGSGRSKLSSSVPKSSSAPITEAPTTTCVARRIEKEWAKKKNSADIIPGEAAGGIPSKNTVVSSFRHGYIEVGKLIDGQIINESVVLAILLARKMILHLIVTMGQDFSLDSFLLDGADRERVARQFWGIIETCASLRCAGWVGEAGAMAIAAEALGLGISSNDHGHSRHTMSDRPGIASAHDLDDGVLLPAGGISQLLSSVMRSNVDSTALETGSSLAACSEAAIGSDGGGGVLVFLQRGLQGALQSSDELRRVLTAAVRRSIRLLAVVEYEGDDSDALDQTEDENEAERSASVTEKKISKDDEIESHDISSLPDARLTSFLTGLLMSKPIEVSLSKEKFEEVVKELFQAWSIGMLSASLPWRMVCAFTVAGILNKCPRSLHEAVSTFPTLARFYGRLESTVSRRVWAERAAVPVCSRYVQAMMELLAAVKRSVSAADLPPEFVKFWGKVTVDAATPLPKMTCLPLLSSKANWESDDGWISSDNGWEVWTGTVEYMSVEWETPSRSPVRSLMDGGEGPPMLREGCHVLRGLDWSSEGSGSKDGDEDGKKLYEAEKEKRKAEEEAKEPGTESAAAVPDKSQEGADPTSEPPQDPVADGGSSADGSQTTSEQAGAAKKKQKKKKIPSPKLPVGTVLSVEPWNGMPGLGRRVKWHRTGKEGVYRYGGDGGRYDISHVEINEKCTRVKKRHPLPESSEQCAARHGFGANKKYSVILRLQRCGVVETCEDSGEEEEKRVGVLEWPDFGAGVLVDCILHSDGAVSLTEKQLIYGSKDAGWEARFGQPSYVAGSCHVLSPTTASNTAISEVNTKSPYLSFYEELLGSTSFKASALRNRADGSQVHVTSEMRLFRGRQKQSHLAHLGPVEAPIPPPIHFDRDYHAGSLSLSRDGRTVSCISSDGRGAAYASVGFTKGVHYWEVKLEQADIGSVFIGVAEKPNSSGSGGSYDTPPRLNRWPGWGFVNFRATYSSGAERVYGAHCHAGDTVGVLLDCDAGRISFFFDGLKYGEHILNDLGCAFENLSPFGFNVDGCGSGGAGQGAPSGIEGGRGGRYPAQGSVRPRALWPVIGLRNQGDRVTISPKWTTSYGVDGVTTTRNVLAVDEILFKYSELTTHKENNEQFLPDWFIKEAFTEYQRWHSGKWKRTVTRGSGPYRQSSFGLDVDVDSSPLACATASAALGLRHALLAGDRVRLLRSAGRILELAEEAVILGAYQGRLFYQIVSQKSEGGSLTEGGGRSWFLDESEVVDGLPCVGKGKAEDIPLPLMDRFKCKSAGGLKISYEGGAVVRSDLEIIDGSLNLGVIPVNTIIPRKDVLERRVNSCGVTRYRVRAKLGEEVKEGWISARIRGGREEAIVEAANTESSEAVEEEDKSFPTALDCALVWQQEFEKKEVGAQMRVDAKLTLEDIETFTSRLADGLFPGLSVVESDSLLAAAVSSISNFSDSGDAVDCSFNEILKAFEFALCVKKGTTCDAGLANPAANQAAASTLNAVSGEMPAIEALMARAALIRAFNRRARLALPWMSIRPCQEGSAILGGLCGHGASTERSGRNRLVESQELWTQVPSIATRARSLRGLFFGSVKKGLLQSITEATATPTPLSHDEYELPREIRTVRINRLRSRIAMAGTDNGAKRKYSVFAQLHNETKGWGGAALRRGYVAKGHGGQRRAFKVKLIGEGVNDYSGPYREAFTDAFSEVLKTDSTNTNRGCLGVLDPTPNNSSDLGENRELFMFSLNGRDLSSVQTLLQRRVSAEERRIWKSFASLTAPRDEQSREVEEALVFLGRITGTAFRHGIPVDLPLSLHSVWRPFVEEESKEDERLREMDELAYRQHKEGELSALLWWQQRMLNSFVEGMSNVLPVEVLTILEGAELRDLICGNTDVDVDLLRAVVEYEGYVETDAAVQYFWETLRELSNDERKLFLQFVWARNRLPLKKSDFEAPFKIQRDSANTGEKADQALPSASTCFFSLALPEYSSKDILKEKLLFAINNVTTMETDFQTNSVEIQEGYNFRL